MINWKVRLKNKTFLVIFVPLLISFVYQLLAVLGITPSIAKETVEELILAAVNLLALLGIVVDPTTSGIGDSERALNYTEPR